MKITDNFYLQELLISDFAARKNISNVPSVQHKDNLIESTVKLWQPTRKLLGAPMLVLSGYRSPKLNKAIGGCSNCPHTMGYAIDFISPGFGTPQEIVDFLMKKYLKKDILFDKLILECPDSEVGGWVHLSYKDNFNEQNKQVLTSRYINGRIQHLNGYNA